MYPDTIEKPLPLHASTDRLAAANHTMAAENRDNRLHLLYEMYSMGQ